MNAIARFFFKRYIRQQVRQGWEHEKNIQTMYSDIRQAVIAEFTEDNEFTVDEFLRELFDNTLRPNPWKNKS